MAAFPGVMLPAHGVGSREDLPLPFTLVVVGAALALAISFLALGVGWRTPKITGKSGISLPRPLAQLVGSRDARGLVTAVGLAVVALIATALIAGQDDANNPVPYVVFVWLWVGIAFGSMLFGPIWSLVNPVSWLHRGLLALARIAPDFALTDYRLGYWPAATGLFAFTWLELIAPNNTSLGTMRVAIAAYVLLDLMMLMVFGREALSSGDPFEAWSGLLGTLSPFGRRDDGAPVLRTPVHGPILLALRPGLLAVAAVMLGGTGYDSFAGQAWWFTFVQQQARPRVVETAGLLGVCLLVATMLYAATAFSARLARVPRRGLATAFAPSLLPIACGYLVAHYWSLFAFEGVNTLAKLSDPLGTGANWLGTQWITPSNALIAPDLVSAIQVIAILTGHILGVIVAHERAVSLFSRRAAVIGQLPLLLLMVLYTCGGLTLLFSA